MTATTRTTAIGIFEDREQARRAVDELKRRGIPDEQMGLLSHREEPRGPAEGRPEGGSNMASGAGIGMLVGASLGGLAVGAGAGPVLAAGGLFTGLLGGAVTGGLVGALIGLGVPEQEARYYQEQLDAGRAIVTVTAPGRYEEAMEVLRRHGARESGSPMSHAGVGNLP